MDLRVRAPLLWAACVLIYGLAQSRHFLSGVDGKPPASTPPVLLPSRLSPITLAEMALAWAAVIVAVPALWMLLFYRRSVMVRLDLASCSDEVNPELPDDGGAAARKPTSPPAGVLIASLEHVVQSEGISVVAGGLGKAMKMYFAYAQRSDRTIKFVFPMVGDQE
eukprot:879366-Prymnesium_polylepis.1